MKKKEIKTKSSSAKKKTSSVKNSTVKSKSNVIIPISKNSDDLIVVGIGASAGGVEAFTALLKNLPVSSGLAYVFILHLDPNYKSHLGEILTRETKIPVIEAAEGMHIQKDRIYFIPPANDIILLNGKFKLASRSKKQGLHLPIDYFFKSLAENYKQRSVGIILSGTASDGSEGLKFIKEAEGLTFVQDPQTAKYDGMPKSAIATMDVDFVLPPDKIALELSRIDRYPAHFDSIINSLNEGNVGSQIINQLFKDLKIFSGTDFSGYKTNTIKRRLSRRMLLNRISNINDYILFLKKNSNEVEQLYNDLLIAVTGFFRDPGLFETIKQEIFPVLTDEEHEDSQIRIWIPGCSTGEEAYSLAIIILEYLDTIQRKFSVQIFATDINENVIDKARMGIYSLAIEEFVSAERLKKFFYKTNTGYRIVKHVREICVFAKQDVSKDPPFSKIDLIICRNLLIYLNQLIQKKVISTFHYSLKPNGILILGPSETIGTYADLFTLINKQFKIYSRKQTFHKTGMAFNFTEYSESQSGSKKIVQNSVKEFDVNKEADKIVMNRFVPAGVIINGKMDIIQFRGNTGKYLDPSPGSASLNLLKLANESMVFELRAAILNSEKLKKPVRKNNIQLRINGTINKINIEIIPLNPVSKGDENFYLILFEEAIQTVVVNNNLNKTLKKKDASTESSIQMLKEELTVTKEYLKSIIDERESANEDLRSTLEELQSTNEELLSINEELETAKEELQSTNEELTTLNEELQNGNQELNQVNNDLVNLLSNVHIPIIILGGDLRIRRFTPSAEKVLNIIATDVGRPLNDLRINLSIRNLVDIIHQVINTLESKEINVQVNNDHWYNMKIRPYKTLDNKIDGVIIAFLDNDDLRSKLFSVQAEM